MKDTVPRFTWAAMSTNWGSLKSWPSPSLRNSSKLPGERNPEH